MFGLDFCVDKTLQRRLGTIFPPIVAGSCAHRKRVGARRIFTFDLEVTTIVRRDHLSINGVRAKSINYFREKSFDFFIQAGKYQEEYGQDALRKSLFSRKQ